MTTNKLVRLEDIYNILLQAKDIPNIGINTLASIQARVTEKAFEPIKGSNHALLEEYILKYGLMPNPVNWGKVDMLTTLREIQSQLTERVEYKIGESYDFADEIGVWYQSKFCGFLGSNENKWKYIRPLPPIFSEEQQAIELLKKSGYTVTK